MRIRQIELNGFKSFMERTVLELPRGVTAVVGPNGCGKSNIVDAIRWVLGEQSPKHLRGTAMEDVVFNGNAASGPLGMAEVSLLLEREESDVGAVTADDPDSDEASHGLPPALANAAEILVTRRYFRSGDSEYFINQVPCRLRDITELFLGTGVGTKAYAIVEQGRVDQLLNAKPEELRLLLEEAAGTTRFRSRKLAAERKMERTRDNLRRVQDVLHEIERQRASLERQARRAEEYRRIKAELRDLDLAVAAGRQRVWSGELIELEKRLAVLHAEDTALHAEIERSRGTTSDARAARVAYEQRLRTVEGEITRQRLSAAEAESCTRALAVRAEDMQARHAEHEREATRLQARQRELAAQMAVLATDVERLAVAQPGLDAERAATEARRLELLDAGAPLEDAVETAKDALLEEVADEARLRNLSVALGKRREELEGRRRRFEDDQRVLADRLRGNTEDGEMVRAHIARGSAELASSGEQRQQLLQAQEELRASEAAQARQLDARRDQATQLQSRAVSLRELQQRHEGCTRGVGSLLARHGTAGDATLLARLLRVPAELERAVAVALGARLTQLVVADADTAVRDITWLTTSAAGSATLIPRNCARRAAAIIPAGARLVDRIEVDPEHWALAEALLGSVLLAGDMETAVGLWRAASHPPMVVTLNGEAIDPLGAITGCSEAPMEETVLARERELREIEGVLAQLRTKIADEGQALSALRAHAVEIAEAVATTEARMQALRMDLVAADKDRERIDGERDRITAELEACALQVGGLTGEDGEVVGELASVEQRFGRAQTLLAERREALTARQAALAQWRTTYAAAEQRRTELAVSAAAATERLRALQGDLGRQRSVLAEIEERAEAAAHQIAAAVAAAATVEQEHVHAEQVLQEASHALETLGTEREGLLASIGEVSALAEADDASERTARERLEALREERSAAELAIAERRMQLDHLAAQLLERYGLGPDCLATIAADEDPQAEARAQQVETLRTRLGRLGEVNPAAIDELSELRTRHEFLQTQRDDLERSLEDLRRTITKLARTSRQRFEETFAAANTKLTEVFPKLFPAGTARLQTTEPAEEGGEPGVEIVVQPAGKKLQSLTLLSGGEKALTAVALILSLFLIRPTPFCLLDEVDAPLDEANIGRFNQVVREMASTSQFVLITHNRRTMEVADTLYGITMEQPGVSKVVSVRLREAA